MNQSIKCVTFNVEYQRLKEDGSFLFAFTSDGNLQHMFLFHGMQGVRIHGFRSLRFNREKGAVEMHFNPIL